MRHLVAYTDGGSRGNPGRAAAAVYLPELNIGFAQYLGEEQTNNEAEAWAVVLALKAARNLHYKSMEILSDSTLIVNQVTGLWQVSAYNLQPIIAEAQRRMKSFALVTMQYVPRTQNKEADWLANQAMDEAAGGALTPWDVIRFKEVRK